MKLIEQNKDILVSVCVITYNQENIINKVLDYILEQQTNFNFEIVIGEDCSTDNTLKICQKYADQYPDKINLIAHQKNLGLIGNFTETIKNCQGKYIAICAGDDFWIDPKKLEIQTKFLEGNNDFTMVATEIYLNSFKTKKNFKQFIANIVNNLLLSGFYETFKILKLYFKSKDEFWKRRRIKVTSRRPRNNDLYGFLKDIQLPRYYAASSTMVRRKVIESLPNQALTVWSAEHLPILIWSALNGQIKLLKEVTVMKNKTTSSVSVTKIHIKNYKINSEERLIKLLEIAKKNTTQYNSNLITQKINLLKKKIEY